MIEDKDIKYFSSEDVQKMLSNTPQRHESLSDDLIIRIVNFKKILGDAESTTIEQAISNFKHDIHPEKEVAIWEWITNIYEYINELYILELVQQKEVLRVALDFSSGTRGRDEFDWVETLPSEILEKMLDLVNVNKDHSSSIPVSEECHREQDKKL